MQKRQFIAAALGAASLPALAQGNAARGSRGPALLTVTGAIGKGNRGAFDPVRDVMMGKQKLSFDKAHAFDYATLAAMKPVTINPTLEYDGKPHKLAGPLLADVLKAAGVTATTGSLAMRAVDGYAPTLSLADAVKLRFIVATHLDGEPMPLGGLGPLWAVYDADRFPEVAAKPVAERFANCPWALFHIAVQA
ncbi:MAG TPA: molybdopterin-dependent oxidoreductase [Ramlibacter sp.]